MKTKALILAVVACLGAPGISTAETLASFVIEGQTMPHPAQEMYVHLALYNDVFQTPPVEIFQNFKLSEDSVGETLVADAGNTATFDAFAERLTNGIDGVFCVVIAPVSRSFEEAECEFESVIASTSSDFEGYEIQSVQLTTDDLSFRGISQPADNFEEAHSLTISIEGTRLVATGVARWSTLKQTYGRAGNRKEP